MKTHNTGDKPGLEYARGALFDLPETKQVVTIRLDKDVLAALKAQAEAEGRGYQTLLNETLRSVFIPASKKADCGCSSGITVEMLRTVLREELKSG